MDAKKHLHDLGHSKKVWLPFEKVAEVMESYATLKKNPNEKIFLNKSYNWEESYDLDRDIEEAADRITEFLDDDERKGQLKVVLTYIPEDDK
ncbi:unnamed protein product [marine sediment metagenome]|uniref:Uncharacterized protein n=1 Tax=marine sediment metagenome TaxID=412755 RepID=X0W7D3_9ZZZZ